MSARFCPEQLHIMCEKSKSERDLWDLIYLEIFVFYVMCLNTLYMTGKKITHDSYA